MNTMAITLIVGGGILALSMIIAMFASDQGTSHFDHMLTLYHQRKLAKMTHEAEMEKIKLQLLSTPIPETDRH